MVRANLNNLLQLINVILIVGASDLFNTSPLCTQSKYKQRGESKMELGVR